MDSRSDCPKSLSSSDGLGLTSLVSMASTLAIMVVSVASKYQLGFWDVGFGFGRF